MTKKFCLIKYCNPVIAANITKLIGWKYSSLKIKLFVKIKRNLHKKINLYIIILHILLNDILPFERKSFLIWDIIVWSPFFLFYVFSSVITTHTLVYKLVLPQNINLTFLGYSYLLTKDLRPTNVKRGQTSAGSEKGGYFLILAYTKIHFPHTHM